jgi:GMP synthase (glutamine-hydrolysing)
MHLPTKSSRVLILDNRSPFTPHLKQIVADLGYSYECRLFSELHREELIAASTPTFNRVILSGRKAGSPGINMINSTIIKYCYARNLPILGICYGCQIIALTLGGTIRKMDHYVKDYGQVTVKANNALVQGKHRIRVFKSHRFCVSKLPQCLNSFGESDTCVNEILIHRSKPIFGTQFHPELSGIDGHGIIAKFMAIE